MGNLALVTSYPQNGASLVSGLDAAVTADEAQFFSLTPGSTTVVPPGASAPPNGGVLSGATDQTLIGGRLLAQPLTVPTAPTVTINGTTGGTTYDYTVEALLGTGNSGASAATAITTGYATLGAVNNNSITFLSVAGATSYKVRRTVGGSTQGVIATVAATGAASYTVVDTGLTGDSTATPSFNTSGMFFASEQGNAAIDNAATYTVTIPSGSVVIKYAGVSAITLSVPVSGAPSAGGMDGCVLNFTDSSGHAHTVTTGTNGFNGASHILTFGGTANNTFAVVASGGVWYVRALGGGTLS